MVIKFFFLVIIENIEMQTSASPSSPGGYHNNNGVFLPQSRSIKSQFLEKMKLFDNPVYLVVGSARKGVWTFLLTKKEREA